MVLIRTSEKDEEKKMFPMAMKTSLSALHFLKKRGALEG